MANFKKNIPYARSVFFVLARSCIVRYLLLEIREASFVNATGPILALSSLIVGALTFKFAVSLIMNN